MVMFVSIYLTIMVHILIAILNVNGLRDNTKCSKVLHWCKMINPGIIFLPNNKAQAQYHLRNLLNTLGHKPDKMVEYQPFTGRFILKCQASLISKEHKTSAI